MSRSGNSLTTLETVKNSEYDQEVSQSQSADKPIALRGRATQPPVYVEEYSC